VKLTDKINDRETFMKGVDYSCYGAQEDGSFFPSMRIPPTKAAT
jgi:hypothetical protein